MTERIISCFIFGLICGGLFGFGWAQSIYMKMLANYRGYCEIYREMLGFKDPPA